jgi:hypothetical protein
MGGVVHGNRGRFFRITDCRPYELRRGRVAGDAKADIIDPIGG